MKISQAWIENVFGCDGAQGLLLNIIEHALDHATADENVAYASEIEVAMALALCAVRKVDYPEFGFYPTKNLTKDRAAGILKTTQSAGGLDERLGCVFPQVEIGPYRVDFLVLHNGGGIVVECDGHEFHEKTKEQAAKDKARDRALQEFGFKVYHFTGSEIWRDAVKCAREVLSQAHTDAVDYGNLAINIQSEGQFAAVVNALSPPF